MTHFDRLRPTIGHLKKPFLFAALLAFLCFATFAARAGETADGSYTVQALTIPRNAFSGQASAINDAGVSAGWYETIDGSSAVSWSADNQLTQLGTLRGFTSALANDINQTGTIVGFAFGGNFILSQAFIWHPDTGMQLLTGLGGDASLAQAINTDGTAVGWAYDAAGLLHAVRWNAAGTLTDLNPPGGISEALGINDAGDVVGWVFPNGGPASHGICGDTMGWRSTCKRWEDRAARPLVLTTSSPSLASPTKPRRALQPPSSGGQPPACALFAWARTHRGSQSMILAAPSVCAWWMPGWSG